VKRLRLTPEAELDLDEAYSWYQAQRPGLAADFLAAVGTCIASIRRRPEAYQLVDPTMRRALLRRFPYAVFYQVGAVVDVTDNFAVERTRFTRRSPRRSASRGWPMPVDPSRALRGRIA